MAEISLNIENSGIEQKDIMAYKEQVEIIHNALHARANDENDFVGWLDLPTNYDKAEFIRIKKASIASLILEYEDVELVNSLIQSEILNYGDVISNLKEIYKNLAYEDILKFLKLIDTKNKSILVLNPLN